jgi:tRNA A-37 threonylcarbamoyl transferase component Bud32/Tfp pilus assembly protein PilF
MLRERVTAEVAGRFVVERELAHGATAVVYLGRDRRHDRRVAIKVLDPALASSLDAARFHREIALLARLQHPHVLPLLDSGEAAGSLFYVVPYVEGGSLRARLQREGALPPADALRVALDVADALAYAHGQGVVHRDVKPENVLLSGYDPDGRTPARDQSSGGRWHALVCDFGIARLTEATTDSAEGRTGRGRAVGTPAYMAPEQASGDRHVDPRSDVWALGVVLYEMLAGRRPHADASSPFEAMARLVAGPPPSVGAARPELPRALVRRADAVLARALAADPARRFATGGEMAAALQGCAEALAPPAAPRPNVARRRALAAALTLAVAAGGWMALRPRPGDTPPDDRAFLVAPPVAEDAADTLRAETRAAVVQALGAGLARWRDVRVLGGERLRGADDRPTAAPPTLSATLGRAREVGARWLVWSRIAHDGARSHVRVALYDAAQGEQAGREARVTLPREGGDARDLAPLADSLLLSLAAAPRSVPAARATSSWEAWQAYDRALASLARWELAPAARWLDAAVRLDADFAPAQLWRAQVLAWTPRPPRDAVEEAVRRALAGRARLAPDDALRAEALLALSERRFPDACGRYGTLVARDSFDVAAWFGLAECLREDEVVLPDRASPSGWRFRSSGAAMLRAYERALVSAPALHVALGRDAPDRLQHTLFTNFNALRTGHAPVGGDTLTFAAAPSLDVDTLAFIPYPTADFASARPWTAPSPTTAAAVARNQRVLLRIAERWAETHLADAAALELLGVARESAGDLESSASSELGALGALRGARAAAGDDALRARLFVHELRVLLKLGRFAEAAAAADSALRVPRQATDSGTADRLEVAAALVGRPDDAASLGERAARADADPLQAPARALLAYAAIGRPVDSIRARRERLQAIVRSYVAPRDQAAALAAALLPAAVHAFPTLGAEALRDVDVSGDYLVEMQAALARGNPTVVRDRLRRRAEARRVLRASDLSMDVVFHEAWIRVAVGDSASAAQLLDAALGALPAMPTSLIASAPLAACLVRAMSLRADLARRAGDRAVEARWSAAARTLWRFP